MPVIGFLGVTSPGPYAPYVAAFREGLTLTACLSTEDRPSELPTASSSRLV
jgi:hypothetical protein